ncbi:hypothetical protein DMUE_1202 [Dictyocoela muelleri]|nr:hypothetical protein DMUE_1202 [Dictyocoela muelleri]
MYFVDGLKMVEIARRLKKCRSTVCKIIEKVKHEGIIKSKKRCGDQKTILTAEHKNIIKNLLDNDATISLQMIKGELCNDHEILVSLRTITNAIHGFPYSLKILTLVPARRNSIDCINNRRLYAQHFYQL